MTKDPSFDDIDFEIRFYEGIIEKKPDFLEALKQLGDLYTKRGHHEKGLNIDLKLASMQPKDPWILYNLACSYSLLKDMDNAFKIIKRAISCGYDNFDYLNQDADLANLRGDTRFIKYLSRIKGRSSQEKEQPYGK